MKIPRKVLEALIKEVSGSNCIVRDDDTGCVASNDIAALLGPKVTVFVVNIDGDCCQVKGATFVPEQKAPAIALAFSVPEEVAKRMPSVPNA